MRPRTVRSSRCHAFRGSHAFTLIELLVVVAIIGVLVALAIPAIGKALDSAAMGQDMSNLRQIGQAISSFASDNNNCIPNVNVPLPPGMTKTNFCEIVDRMMAPDGKFSASYNYNFIRRPVWFSRTFAKMPPGAAPQDPTQYYWGIAWGMNTYLWNRTKSPFSSSRPFEGNLNQAPNLSKLVLVGEKNRNGGNEFRCDTAPSFERNAETEYRISRNGKAYYLFADYHIELIAGDQSVAANASYKTYNPTNRLYYAW